MVLGAWRSLVTQLGGIDAAELRVAILALIALEDLALPCRLNPWPFSSSPTTTWLTVWPCALSSSASTRRLLQLQRRGDSASPRVPGSTSASRSITSVGSFHAAAHACLFAIARTREVHTAYRLMKNGLSCFRCAVAAFRPGGGFVSFS
jgi:hypothetical protein